MTNRLSTLTDLKNDPAGILEKSEGQPELVLDNNKPWAYMVPVETFERMQEKIEDYRLLMEVQERMGDEAVSVSVEPLRRGAEEKG
ncbi:MAG: type II toxin-antitoxin system prevent-host-death family antitoxin [Pseudomonadota bacterium]|nr:type II toxin-antitoxin system prevent-host-death family antitoxin [Pseudomonadota bacterium]